MFIKIILVLGLQLSLRMSAWACPPIDSNEVMARLQKTERISEAMVVRESYEASLCSLDNIEIVSRLEQSGDLGADLFPAYNKAISSFVLDHLRKLSPNISLSALTINHLETLFSRMTFHDSILAKYDLGAVAKTCSELVLLMELPNQDLKSSENYGHQIVSKIFRKFQNQVGCRYIRF